MRIDKFLKLFIFIIVCLIDKRRIKQSIEQLIKENEYEYLES